MRAFPEWTRLVEDETGTVHVNRVSAMIPAYRGGSLPPGVVLKELEEALHELEGRLPLPAANVATWFFSTVSQDGELACHTLLVETGTSLRLEVCATMSFLRTWVARAMAVIRRYPCGTYAVGQNGQPTAYRVIWVEFPLN